MRILSEDELDQVFGGDSYGVTKLATVNVTGPTYQTIGNYFTYSYSAPYSESGGGSSGGSWSGGSSNSALPSSQLPILSKVRCQANAAAVPGHAPSDVPDYALDMYNSHAYKWPNSQSYYFTSGGYQPPGTQQLRGLTFANPATYNASTQSYSGGKLTLYADAVVATTGNTYSHSYYDDANNLVTQGKTLGVLTAEENTLMVTLHETQHAYQFVNAGWMASQGRADIEADAETFAIKGLERFRAGIKGSCN